MLKIKNIDIVEITDFNFQTRFEIAFRYSSYDLEQPTMFLNKILVKIVDLCEKPDCKSLKYID